MTDDRTTHWDNRYAGAEPQSLSWFEAAPALSLRLIGQAAGPEASVIDMGGGASRMPDALLEAGYKDITVLDLSAEALALSRAQLGERAAAVDWQVADVTHWQPARRYDLWHDRAVFHFLTDAGDRAAYARALNSALAPGGTAIIMSFADDGPERCSGLPVQRYAPEDLVEEIDRLLPGLFEVKETGRFAHMTPGGAEQRFQYTVFQKRAGTG
ncbi:class I SAM-dependent methyltransferase [Nioella sediminis]|jgi:SAM-dependent methyltransferase|uniref:class I SAM-dependent methyltransferase n=1 Tax=Nioella sediminis TaxID=1912092 RepID=UPI0008FD6871|nr:class I SAM-dependent methyltransferase [Nioella sediminis]TBX28788.1 SAM-dependent methyltransferase [Roseovarius sp. JS7-11]